MNNTIKAPSRTRRAASAQPAPKEAAAIPAAPAHEDSSMNETITSMANEAQDKARSTFAAASQGAKDAMEKGQQAATDAVEFHKGNIEAMVESTRIAAQGFQSMAQARAAFAKQSFDTTTATVKSLATVGSPTDFFRLQGDYLRTSMDALVGEMSRETEASLKLAGEIAQPIQNRVALAMAKAKVAA